MTGKARDLLTLARAPARCTTAGVNWSDGTVVLNGDPTYDTNGQINPVRESFTELVPLN